MLSSWLISDCLCALRFLLFRYERLTDWPVDKAPCTSCHARNPTPAIAIHSPAPHVEKSVDENRLLKIVSGFGIESPVTVSVEVEVAS